MTFRPSASQFNMVGMTGVQRFRGIIPRLPGVNSHVLTVG